MKNKIIAIIVIVAVVAIAWFSVLTTSISDGNQVEELAKKIEANIEVRTYKNTLPMYEELIKLEPENIRWYTGLADAYVQLEQYGNYLKQCEEIVKTFPNDKIGHLRLINYYAATNEAEEVIKTFLTAPESIQKEEEFLSIYKKYEWNYCFMGKSYSFVSPSSNGIYVVGANGLFGYKSKDLSNEIDMKFEVARPFINGVAAVYKDEEWYFVDKAGDRVLATKKKLEDLYSMSNGIAVAKINGKYGYIDSEFNEYSFEYEDATSFLNGVAAVKKDGKWGLITNELKMLTEFTYDDVIRDEANVCSRKGVIFLRKGNVYHMLNLEGKKISDETFEDAKLFYSEYGAVKKNGKWGFVDNQGNTVIEFKYDDASSFASGIAAVKFGEQWGCVDKEGNVILPFEYTHTMVTNDNGVVAIKLGEAYRFIKFIKFE